MHGSLGLGTARAMSGMAVLALVLGGCAFDLDELRARAKTDASMSADAGADGSACRTYYEDADGDGYGTADTASMRCEPGEGWVDGAGDCDNTNAAVHPGAAELCDGVDDDCDAATADGHDEATLGHTCDSDDDADMCADDVWVCAEGQLLCQDGDAALVELCSAEDITCTASVGEVCRCLEAAEADTTCEGCASGRCEGCLLDADCGRGEHWRCDSDHACHDTRLLRFDSGTFERSSQLPEGAIYDSTYLKLDENGRPSVAYAEPNQPRWEDRGDGHGPVMLFEGERTNFLRHSTATTVAPWQSAASTDYQGVHTEDAAPGPDRQMTADRIELPEDGYSNFQRVLGPDDAPADFSNATPVHISAWLKTTGRRFPQPARPYLFTGGSFQLQGTDPWHVNAAWQRFSRPGSGWDPETHPNTSLRINNQLQDWMPARAEVDGLLDAHAWGWQIEVGEFPSSSIPTGSELVRRARDELSLESAEVPSAMREEPWAFDVYPIFHSDECTSRTHPLYAFGETTSDWRIDLLCDEDGNARLRVLGRNPTGELVGSGPLVFRRHQKLHVTVHPATRLLRVEGALAGNGRFHADSPWRFPSATLRVGSSLHADIAAFARISEPRSTCAAGEWHECLTNADCGAEPYWQCDANRRCVDARLLSFGTGSFSRSSTHGDATPLISSQPDSSYICEYTDKSGARGERLCHAWPDTLRWGDSNGMRLALFEGSRTNRVRHSSELNAEPWSDAADTRGASVTPDAQLAPDGTMDADVVEDTETGQVQSLRTALGGVSAGTYTASLWVKKTDSDQFMVIQPRGAGVSPYYAVRFNTHTGEYAVTGNSPRRVFVYDRGDWWRIGVSCDYNDGWAELWLYPASSDSFDGEGTPAETGSVTLWGIQFEEGLFPSTPIPTSGKAVMRAGDRVVFDQLSAAMASGKWAVDVYPRFSSEDLASVSGEGTTYEPFGNQRHVAQIGYAWGAPRIRVGSDGGTGWITWDEMGWQRNERIHFVFDLTDPDNHAVTVSIGDGPPLSTQTLPEPLDPQRPFAFGARGASDGDARRAFARISEPYAVE